MVTYNHERYINQAIKSIVNQKTNFPIKLFIGEDYSTDRTRTICLEMKEKYPGKIELILNEKNIGPLRNAANVYDTCIKYGKYTAICEGDDYWTDNKKLQKQVDFLEANDDFNISCHRAIYLNEKNKTFSKPQHPDKTVFTQADIANHNLIQSLTAVYRNKAFKELPEAYFKSISGDYFINMMISKTGNIKYLPETMAVYRQQSMGAWQSGSDLYGYKSTLSISDHYLKSSPEQVVKSNLKKNIVRNYIHIADAHIKENNITSATNEIQKVLDSRYADAWIHEIRDLLYPRKSKEYIIGSLMLKPFRLYQRLKSRVLYRLHKLYYD